MKTCPLMPKSAPPPGFYPGTTPEEYHTWAALSASVLKRMLITPKACRRMLMSEPKPPTAAMRLGTAVHLRLLNPERFDVVAVDVDGLRPAAIAKTWAKHEEAEDDDALLLAEGWRDDLDRIADQAARNHHAKALLGGKGINEVAVVWKNGLGLTCKALIDRITTEDGEPVFVEVKTTRHETDEDFARDCWQLGYDVQLWHYRQALAAASELYEPLRGRREWRPVVIAIGTIDGDVAVMDPIEEGFLDVAQIRHNEVMRRFAWCYANDEWPGMGGQNGRSGLVLPQWALARYQQGVN